MPTTILWAHDFMQKDLFDHAATALQFNILPADGRVHYLPALFNAAQCNDLFNLLWESLQWQADQLVMFGRKVTTLRKVAWVGDAGCSYTYSGVEKHPQAWTPELLMIKKRLEQVCDCEFNSCLLNLYHNGSEGMGWHSDDEKELDSDTPIASLSLGGVRRFAFRHKQDKEQTDVALFLENGSLLIMHAPTQQYWNHSLPKTRTVVAARINLTFRKIVHIHP